MYIRLLARRPLGGGERGDRIYFGTVLPANANHKY
jgi:hypothetical protein